jgi:putative ABC transport system permease protein
MTLATFILKNALRNVRRAALTISSVAVSTALMVSLMTLERELMVPPEAAGASLRIIARNKVSLMQPLPAKQLSAIQRIPGIVSVTPFTYFGGLYADEEFTSFAQFGVDPVPFQSIIVDARIVGGSYDEWVKNRTGCLVGQDTMKRYKLKVGDRMRFRGTFYPCDLDVRIDAVYQGTVDDRNIFFQHKLLDELTGDPGTVGTWYLRAESAEVADRVIQQVNDAFANTSAEVRAESERAFQMGFVSMWGNVSQLIRTVNLVVVFTLALVAVSTMSMAVRERFRELAVLKALGFQRRDLFGFILAEGFGLSVLGGALGIGGAWAFWTFSDIQGMTKGILLVFEVTPRIMGMAATVATVLGVFSSVGPAIAVGRMSVVQGLKTLD